MKFKEVFKFLLSVLICSLLLIIVVGAVPQLYDHRIFLALIVGFFGVDPLMRLLGKIKGLQ